MGNLFLAKSNPKETIIEHTENLLKEYEKIKNIYPNLKGVNWELLYLACLYHDIGKMNTKFQNKIMNNINKEQKEQFQLLKDDLENIEEISHGYLSNAFIPYEYLEENFTKEEIKILYESIFYHHNREKLQGHRKEDLDKVIKEDLNKYYKEFKYEKLLPYEKLNYKFSKYLRSRVLEKYPLIDEEGFIDEDNLEINKTFIMTKGLLNKIDFAASSGVTVEYEPEDLQKYTEKSIEKYGLNKLQEYMKENQNNNLIIKASTGIGKTEGALIWIGKNKGFFTLPLRVSINSIYDRIIDKNKIAYPKEKTGLLHSDTASEYMKKDENHTINKEYLNSTKQLSMALTVCTLDQLIGFIFKYEGFELKLATLSYSKLVIDEIQMYSPDMVAYLILALRDIVAMGGKFAIVTATFPPIFEYFMNYIGLIEGKTYIKPKEPFLKESKGSPILRHKMKIYNQNINGKIIYENSKGKKVLVIVNTVKLAQKLYEEIKGYGDINVHMFHSRYTKEDRKDKEDKIFKDGQLENYFEGIWITTQVVEASLDIDFDVLYTELSDLAGLLQRMGRVYRNRPLDSNEPNIHVFVGDENNPSGIREENSIIDIDIFKKSKEVIINYDNCEINEKTKMEMVEKVYAVKNLEKSKYFKKIKETILAFNDIQPYDLKKNEIKLREILSETVIPESIYIENKNKIEQLIEKLKIEKELSEKIKIKDEIMKKTLTIPLNELQNIERKCGNIKNIQLNNYEKIYVVPLKYSSEKGLEREIKVKEFDEDQFL